MNIWYCNHYASAPSHGGSGRPYFLARELMRLGHEALIVAASHQHLRLRPSPPDQVNQPIEVDGARFLFLPTRPYTGNNHVRYLNMLDYARGIRHMERMVSEGILKKPDVIIASSVHLFVYPPALRLARRLSAKIVFEVRDLWPLSLVEIAGLHPWHPVVKIMERIERNAYRTADAVVCLLSNALEHMAPRGLSADRFFWIPNGVWAQEWGEESTTPLPEPHQMAIDRCRQDGKLLVVYAGAIGPPNAMDQVLDLVHVRAPDRPYHFLIIGDGVLLPELVARAQEQRIDFITFLPRIPKASARAAIRQADVCFIGWQDRAIYRFGISANKLFEYMMAARPVLHAIRSSDDPVLAARAGISVPPYNPEALDVALRELAGKTPSERDAMGKRGHEYVLSHYEWSLLGKRYADICSRLLKP